MVFTSFKVERNLKLSSVLAVLAVLWLVVGQTEQLSSKGGISLTTNQLAYWRNVEDQRANRARESENYRSNVARESENTRTNQANEALKFLGLRIENGKLVETSRHNLASESLTGRELAQSRELKEKELAQNKELKGSEITQRYFGTLPFLAAGKALGNKAAKSATSSTGKAPNVGTKSIDMLYPTVSKSGSALAALTRIPFMAPIPNDAFDIYVNPTHSIQRER